MHSKQWVKLILGIVVIAVLVWLLIAGIGFIKRIFFSSVEMVNQAGNQITISSAEEGEWTPPEIANKNPAWSDQDYDQVYPIELEDDLDDTPEDELEEDISVEEEDLEDDGI